MLYIYINDIIVFILLHWANNLGEEHNYIKILINGNGFKYETNLIKIGLRLKTLMTIIMNMSWCLDLTFWFVKCALKSNPMKKSLSN